jgi:hypothetical protein
MKSNILGGLDFAPRSYFHPIKRSSSTLASHAVGGGKIAHRSFSSVSEVLLYPVNSLTRVREVALRNDRLLPFLLFRKKKFLFFY